MKSLAVVFLLVPICAAAAVAYGGATPSPSRKCDKKRSLEPRPHSVSIREFGAVGDGKILNTIAFQNAIFYLKSFTDKGGAQLYVPKGRWLTGSFNLTSHLTVFLEKDAVILGSQDYSHWEIVEPLSSYGRGIELPGKRYGSLITGVNLTDVVITGDNGTIDGQGSIWWEKINSHTLNYSRPHVIEFISCHDIIISNITFINPPSWGIHPVYCSGVDILNITSHSPGESPYTAGIVPDSSENVCIENSNISTGHDAIAVKSGWDEYGIAFGKPTSGVHVRNVRLRSSSGAGLALGSEMSGGIRRVTAEGVEISASAAGISLRTAKGRGGYIEDINVSGVFMEGVRTAIEATGHCDSHPDDGFDPLAVPSVTRVLLRNMLGVGIAVSGNFSGLRDSPFTRLSLVNITFSPSPPWLCTDVSGSSRDVFPDPCPALRPAAVVAVI